MYLKEQKELYYMLKIIDNINTYKGTEIECYVSIMGNIFPIKLTRHKKKIFELLDNKNSSSFLIYNTKTFAEKKTNIIYKIYRYMLIGDTWTYSWKPLGFEKGIVYA